MSVINTNITSLIAQSNLNKSQQMLSTAMERLSSGMRINSAKDDAAGQAIANRMTAQVTGLNQAQRNANDGISVAQTAEGALNQINDNLQRIRELSVQAANETNSSADLQSVQDEIDQRLGEIDRISRETDFNGVKVLASDNDLKIQVGANDGELINVGLQEITSTTLNVDDLDVRSMVFSSDLQATATFGDAEWNDFEFSATGATFELAVGLDNTLYVAETSGATNVYYEATFDADAGTIEIGAITASITDSNINTSATEFDSASGAVAIADVTSIELSAPTQGYTVYMVNGTAGAAQTTSYYVEGDDGSYYAATLDTATGEIEVAFTTATSVATTAAGVNGGATAGASVSADQILDSLGVPVDMSTVDAELDTGTNTLYENTSVNGSASEYVVGNEDADGNVAYYAATVDDTTGAVTLGDEIVVDPLETLDGALAQVDSLRSDLGAIQNRFQDAITNLNTNETNLMDARSRIEDADYAKEVAEMTRAQILQQAGTSVLAQANQLPQNVLSLLG